MWIRESILQLGPTFIKLGQLFSTRSDLFPAEFTEELSKLQARPPHAALAKLPSASMLPVPPGALACSPARPPIACRLPPAPPAWLQDRVPAFSADKAEAIIERELGAPVGVLFKTFDRQPIAAASLGQVRMAGPGQGWSGLGWAGQGREGKGRAAARMDQILYGEDCSAADSLHPFSALPVQPHCRCTAPRCTAGSRLW